MLTAIMGSSPPPPLNTVLNGTSTSFLGRVESFPPCQTTTLQLGAPIPTHLLRRILFIFFHRRLKPPIRLLVLPIWWYVQKHFTAWLELTAETALNLLGETRAHSGHSRVRKAAEILRTWNGFSLCRLYSCLTVLVSSDAKRSSQVDSMRQGMVTPMYISAQDRTQ